MTPAMIRMITTITITPTIPMPPFLEYMQILRFQGQVLGVHASRSSTALIPEHPWIVWIASDEATNALQSARDPVGPPETAVP